MSLKDIANQQQPRHREDPLVAAAARQRALIGGFKYKLRDNFGRDVVYQINVQIDENEHLTGTFEIDGEQITLSLGETEHGPDCWLWNGEYLCVNNNDQINNRATLMARVLGEQPAAESSTPAAPAASSTPAAPAAPSTPAAPAAPSTPEPKPEE